MSSLRRLHRDTGGQAMAEYALVLAMLVIGLSAAALGVRHALLGYFARYLTWINLPFP